MPRTSRAFGARPFFKEVTSEQKVVPGPVKIEAKKVKEKSKLEDTETRAQSQNTSKYHQSNFNPLSTSISTLEELCGDGDQNNAVSEIKQESAPKSSVRRRGSGFEILPISNELSETSTSEKVESSPPQVVSRKGRFQSKPFLTTSLNVSTSSPVIKTTRQKSSQFGRRPFNDVDLQFKIKPTVVETNNSEDEEVPKVEPISAEFTFDKSRPFDENISQHETEADKVEIEPNLKAQSAPQFFLDFNYGQEGNVDAGNKELEANDYIKHKEKRAKVLKNMLKLDMVDMKIFVMKTYDYERYMTAANAAKSSQAYTQTNEDCSEEGSQTEPLKEGRVRWTQMPPMWSDNNNALTLEQSIRARNLGVGEDSRFVNGQDDLSKSGWSIDNSNKSIEIDFIKQQGKFLNFVRGATHLIMAILESKEQVKKQLSSVVNLDRKLVVLKDLEIRAVSCDHDLIGCANGHSDFKKHSGGKNVVTVWTLHEPSYPMYYLRVWGQVMVLEICKFCSLIVTGNKDGSLNLWDLREPAHFHTKNREDQVIRTPSISTGGLVTDFQHHTTSIIGLQILPETQKLSRVFSLDKSKVLVYWGCSHEKEIDILPEIGFVASTWSTLRIKIRQVINLEEAFLPTSVDFKYLKMWNHNSFHFLIGTDYGYLGKGIVADLETKVKYEKIYADPTGSATVTSIRCLDLSYDKRLVLGGCADDNLRVFDISTTMRKLILTLYCGGVPVKVRWSKRRFSLFYVLLHNQIDIWDMLASDVVPTKSIHFENLKDFELLNTRSNEYMVVISGKEIMVQTPPIEVSPLTTKEESRFKLYLEIIQ